VNISELIDHVALAASHDKESSAAAVDVVRDGVVATVKSGDKLSLLGFGVFSPTSRVARQGRNPQIGAPMKIAASEGVRFAPGSPFQATLNAQSGAKKSAPAKAAKAPANAATTPHGHSRGGQDREGALAPWLAGQRPPTKGRTPLWLP
jgi:nucleoid DNA-binding protein